MFKDTQKLRVIVNDVSIYTTAGIIRAGMCASSSAINDAVRGALRQFEFASRDGTFGMGLSTLVGSTEVQIDIVN